MEPKTTKKPSRKLVVFKRELPFYLMLIPGVTFLIIFSYLPMFGLVMAFQDFTPLRSFKNSPWVGLKNFHDMLALPTFWNVVGNTLSISIAKIILRLLVPLILALLLNEVIHPKFMRMAQTVFFLPYFLSWAVMGGVLRNLFQYDGIMNFFRGIPTEIEDAAVIDGANQMQILFRVYLPMSMPSLATIILFATVANWNCWMDGYMYMNTPDKYPLQTYLATILMESKNNVETLMTPEQLIRMAKVSEKTIEAAQIFLAALPIMCVYPFLQKYYTKGIVVGSVKG